MCIKEHKGNINNYKIVDKNVEKIIDPWPDTPLRPIPKMINDNSIMSNPLKDQVKSS